MEVWHVDPVYMRQNWSERLLYLMANTRLKRKQWEDKVKAREREKQENERGRTHGGKTVERMSF